MASEAKTAASSAQSAATTAQTQASSAQKIANDASVIATNAKNTADQAAEDASSAITAAAEAKTTATNANTTATNAQTTANNASSAASKVASDLTTSTNQLNKKIADETDARTAAISKLNDGLTTETSQRKSEDAALLNNIETYKSSTNGTLSSLQTQINTNATNTSANTSKISSLDSRLTTNEGKTADAINAAATAQQTANTAVTNAAAAASAVTSLKSELSTGKGINNIIAPFSDPQELSPYIIGASRTVALVKSPMRIKGNAYDVTFNAVAGSIYFGSSSLATVNTAAAGVVSGGKRYMLSAYLKNLDATKQADVYFTLHWFKRAANGTFTASQSVLLNQATNNTRVTPSNDGGTISCKAVAAPPDAVAFAVICSGNGVYNVAGSRILIDMLMLEEVVGVDVPASTWTAGPTDLSAIKSALDANASAISKIDTRVTNAEGTISSQGNSITQLNNSVTSINGELTKKADATALNALTNRVSTAEGTISSQGNSITSLRNDLNATNDKVSSKADSSALNSLDSKVTSIDGRVTSNTSAVTSLQGRVSTVEAGLSSKADASALSNYYTKTEADAATSGAINSFNSQLTIGGVNVVANSEAPRTSTAATNKEYLLYERSAELKAFYDENLDKPITISFEMSVPVVGSVQVYSSNGSAHTFATNVNAVIANQFIKYAVTVTPKAHTASTTVSTIEFYGTYGTGRIPTIRKLQIEAGTKATAWSPSPRDTKAAIDANASAISSLSNTVTQQGNTITSHSNSITSLNNSITSINSSLTNKADASALNNLSNRVTAAEGNITSQGNSITSLNNTLTNNDLSNLVLNPDFVDPKSGWTSGVIVDATDAAPNPPSPKALKLNNRDSYYGPFVKCNVGDMFYVSAWFATPNTSATASAVIGFNTRNSAGTYTWYTVAVKSTDKNAWGLVEGYFTVPAGMVDIRPWLQVSIAASEAAGQQWHVTNIQVRNITGNKKLASDLQATSSALSTLDSKVTNIDGRVTSASNNIVSLNNSVTNINATLAQKADATALNSLSNRVTNAEGNITSQGNSITQLNNSVTSINGELTKKADATALNALTNRVSTAEGTISSQGNSITSLRNDLNATNDKVSSKADSSALNSLDSKVTSIDGRVTSNTSAVTSLQGRVSTVEAGLSSKADASALSNYYTKTEADAATSGAFSSFKSQLAIGGVSVVANSEQPRSSTVAINKEYLLYERSAELKACYDENLDKPITISFEMSVPVVGSVQVYSSNGSAHTFATNVNAVIANQFIKYAVTVTPKAHTASTTVSTIEFYGTYGTGRIPTIRKLQIEAGTKATAWSPSPRDTKAAIDANASAISSLSNTVTQQGNTITSHSNSITSLNNSITSINSSLTNKADASALNNLSNRVTAAEGNITSQGNSITSLNNTLTNNDLSNLVLNPDFVDPKSGWTSGVIVDATDAAPNPPSPKALKLNNRDSYYGPFVKCNVGDMFYVSAWFATPNTSATASAVIGFNTRNSAGTYTWYTVAVKSTDKNAWGLVEGYFTVPAGMVDIRPWLQVSIAASEAAGQQWHVTNIQVRNITGNKKLASDLQATSSALSTLDSKVTNIDGRVTSASNNIVSLNNSVTNINATLAQKADATALNSLSNRVTNAEGNITSQGNSITSLTNSLAVSGKGGTNLLIKSNVVGLYDGVSYPHHTYKLGEDWEIGAKYTLIWCAEHKRGTGDNNSYLAVYAGGGSQTLQSIVNTDGKVISKVTFVKNSAVASGPIIHFYMINRPTADKGTIGTVYWAVLVKGDVLTTDAWIPSPYDYIPDSNANAAAIINLTNTVTQQGNTLTSHTNSITSLNNSITTINGTLSSKADSSALNSLTNRVSTAEGAISSQGSSITSLNSSVTGILKDIEVTDTRSTNQPPSWYWSNYPKRIVREFKQASTLGLTGMGTYVSLETYVYYSDATGGPIIQIARGTDSKLTAERRSTSTSTWGTWVQDIKAISDGLANKAEASALSSLDSKVSVIDGKVSTQASSITTLQTTVGGNTASIQSQQQSIDGLKARATLKLQSGNLVGGVGIENDSKTVDFIIQANRFAIGAPSDVTGTVTPKYAFAYQSTPTTLPNGTVIPAGLYLDNASIGYINASRIWADNLSAISADLGTIKVKNANIEDGAIDTLKIKDEAVTVPIGVKAIDVKTITTFAGGVTSGQPNNDFNNHLAAWENHIGTLLQVTLNRSGGKVRLDASVNICTPTFGAFSVSDGRGNPIAANDRAMASFYISIYKNGSLIGRGSLGANIETGNINVNFNGTAVIVSAIDDNSTIGNVTYTLKAGFARQEGVNIPLNVESRSNFMITSRTLSVIEMKK
ncbi:hypothetical protein [Acinetobacter baumannii]|uniref:hypothetical protein n=1 Tax=Acinetobacter baumannii TaxID=470 RepID=UPI003F65732F